MVKLSPTVRRRSVLSAVGAGLLSTVVSGSAAASDDGTESTDDQTGDIQIDEEIKAATIVATNAETGEEFIFESLEEYDPTELSSGEYRFEYQLETADGLVGLTEIAEIDSGQITAAIESGTELQMLLDSDKGISPTGTLTAYVSASTDEGGEFELVPDATVEFELIDNDGEVVAEKTENLDDGTSRVEFDLDVEEGEYELQAEWTEEGITNSDTFDVGPLVEFAFPSGPLTSGEEVGIGISRTLEGEPAPATVDVEVEAPDGSTESIPTAINEGGVGLVEFTPESDGEYRLSTPNTFGRTVDVRELRLFTEGFRLRDQLVDEPIVYGGIIVDSDLSTVAEEPIEVELKERFGDGEVFETVETSTDADGRFTVEFSPLQEADSYTVSVQSADGQFAGEERIRLNEIEDDEPDPTPDISVSVDEFRAAPGEEITAEIELVDAADEPISNESVTIVEKIGFGSFNMAYLTQDEVTTDINGDATYDTTIPDPYAEYERFEIIAVADIDGEEIEDSDNVFRVITVSHNIDLDWDLAPGDTAEASVTINDALTEDPVVGTDFGVVYGRDHPLRGGNFGVDTGTTDNTGTAEFSFEIPDDARSGVRFNVVDRPSQQVSSRRIANLSDLFVDTELPDEVDPGESFEVTYEVDGGASVTGMIFLETSNEARVATADPGEAVTLEMPSTAGGDRARLVTGAIDESGHIVSDFNSISVTGEEPDEGALELSFDPVEGNVGPEETITYELIVEDATEGISGYEFTAEIGDIDVATITDAELIEFGGQFADIEIADDGSDVFFEEAVGDQDPADPTFTIAELTVEAGEDEGTTQLEFSDAELQANDGSEYDLDLQSATVAVIDDLGPDVTGDGNPAQDLTGDGLYEDVDGDGEADIFDVQALFDNRDEDIVQENTELFDFTGDGDVSIFDVQDLFDRI